MAVTVSRLPSRLRPSGRRALDGGAEPRLVPALPSRDKLSVIALAALTSASVSLLTLWLGGEVMSRSREGPIAEVSASLSAPAPAVSPAPVPPLVRSAAADQSPSYEPVAQQPPQGLTSPDTAAGDRHPD